ncbi:MAG: hypothetical protein P8018_00220, partial [Acidobacteriota bacterium]
MSALARLGHFVVRPGENVTDFPSHDGYMNQQPVLTGPSCIGLSLWTGRVRWRAVGASSSRDFPQRDSSQ